MRDINKLCKICLNPGTRDIFDSGFTNIVSRDELNRIAEKLRFVTLLKVSPKENLPQQICDLCIVQLNVSYNFKRLALKNDFYIRQYMIENGMNLLKDDDDQNMETSLEIHQIHNVIRTSNRYRQPPVISSISNEPFRRNSTTSSVSGISTLIVNSTETNGIATNGNSSDNQFAQPSRPFVQPIQIKTEPIDPDEEVAENNGTTMTQSSPSSSSSNGSVLTINSSEKSRRTRPKTPMIIINGQIENSPKSNSSVKEKEKIVKEKGKEQQLKEKEKENEKQKDMKENEKLTKNKENEEPKKAKTTGRTANIKTKKTLEKPRDNFRNLRTIKKQANPVEGKRKIREAAKKIIDKRNQQQKDLKLKKVKAKKTIKVKIVSNKQKANSSKNKANNKKSSGQRKPMKTIKGQKGKEIKKWGRSKK